MGFFFFSGLISGVNTEDDVIYKNGDKLVLCSFRVHSEIKNDSSNLVTDGIYSKI